MVANLILVALFSIYATNVESISDHWSKHTLNHESSSSYRQIGNQSSLRNKRESSNNSPSKTDLCGSTDVRFRVCPLNTHDNCRSNIANLVYRYNTDLAGKHELDIALGGKLVSSQVHLVTILVLKWRCSKRVFEVYIFFMNKDILYWSYLFWGQCWFVPRRCNSMLHTRRESSYWTLLFGSSRRTSYSTYWGILVTDHSLMFSYQYQFYITRKLRLMIMPMTKTCCGATTDDKLMFFIMQ